MNTKLIAKNSAWLFIGRIATAGLNLLLTVIVARTLGEAGFGQYTFIISLAYLGNTATTFGMDTLVMREVSGREESAPQQATAALGLQLGLSVAYIFLLATASLFWETPRAPLVVYLLILLPLAFGTVFSA
ncbi:MAG: oligosaccharide flippase family protein, partial [Chloroflexota bacterium]